MAGVTQHRFLGVFTTLLFLNFFVSVHYATTLYVNSSFLGQFFSPQGVSILYIVSSLFVMLMLANAAHIVEKIGVWRPYIVTAVLLQLTVLTLGFLKDPTLVIIFFIAQGILVFILSYFLDLYLESLQRSEGNTGNVRSMYITAGNIGIFLGPLIISVVLIGTHFAPVYIFAAVALIPVILIALFPLRGITPHAPTHTSFVEAFNDLRCCRENVRGVMVVHLVMQLFNSVITIYGPLYLFEVGGMSWQAIGSLTALALVPYLFLEIPLGFIAARVLGEKELMIIGLSILGVSLILLTVTPL